MYVQFNRPNVITESFAFAAVVVDARLDSGNDHDRRCREDPKYHEAVEVLRLWRAYYPGRLRQLAVESKRLLGQ